MDLARTVYSRELKIAAMRALDAGETGGQVARRLQLSPKLLARIIREGTESSSLGAVCALRMVVAA